MHSLTKILFFFCIVSQVAAAGGQLTSFSVSCKTKPVLFVFGDSNSDTGGSNSARGEPNNYPNGRVFPTVLSDRFSDGRLIVDFMCENLTVNYLSAYMNSMMPNFTHGVNFAVAGVTTSNTTFSLETQIKQLKRFHNLSLELPMKGYQNLNVQEDFQNAMYVIDIGQNDLGYALSSRLPASYIVASIIPHSLEVIKNAIMAIYNLGGRYLWIHNTGPIGCLPFYMANQKVNSSQFDEHGCIRSYNDVAKTFNSQLETFCQQMRLELTDATIVFVDIYSIKYNLYAYYDVYGFINPQKACCEPCLNIGSYICKESARYISWDGVHYTEAANKLVASKIFSENFSKPPLPFNFFCNN